MQSLITVGLRMVHPVAQTVGVTLVNTTDGYVDIEAIVHLFLAFLGLEDNSYGQNIVYLIECNMLVLHLTPYRIRALDACLDLIIIAHVIQHLTYGISKVFEERVTRLLRGGQLSLYGSISVGMLVAEAQVFQLCFYLVQAQAIGQGGVDVKRFACYLIAFVGGLRGQCAHVMQTVAYLDEYNTYVITHGKQQLLEVLSLRRGLFAEDATAYLREPIHNLGYLRAEDILDVFYSIIGVFHHIMQQGGANTGRAEPHLAARNLRYGNGVHDIWFAGEALHALMSLSGEVESLGYDVYFLTVA